LSPPLKASILDLIEDVTFPPGLVGVPKCLPRPLIVKSHPKIVLLIGIFSVYSALHFQKNERCSRKRKIGIGQFAQA
jgi:hypothetical protein